MSGIYYNRYFLHYIFSIKKEKLLTLLIICIYTKVQK